MAKLIKFLKKIETPQLIKPQMLSPVKRTAYRYISMLKKEGRIVKVAKGIYARSDADPYYIASHIYTGYIAFASALYVSGLKTETEKIIYVAVGKNKREIKFQDRIFKPVGMGKFFFGSIKNEKGIYLSNYPKTIFDMFHKPRYADFYSLYRALRWKPLREEEWETLAKLAKMAPLSTVRRLGYGLEGKAPEWFIKQLEKLNEPRGVSFFIPHKAKNLNKKWRVYDPQNIRRWLNE